MISVVSEIEHAADEGLIAGLNLFVPLVGRTVRQSPDDKSPFGTHRHDDRVLHDLCFDQTQYFGSEVLRPI